MLYLIDSANLDAIRTCCEFYPVAGVTTTPTIISRERGNFRELNAMLTRLATLAPAGRIDLPTVQEEIDRQRNTTPPTKQQDLASILGDDYESRYDMFDLMQLSPVVDVCRSCASLSEAGRKLYAISRKAKNNPNDADRLKKYLAHFNLTFQQIKSS